MNLYDNPADISARLLSAGMTREEAAAWVREHAAPYRELMAYYHCAMMEVETKFKVLSSDFSLRRSGNPIESIKTRLKTPESIMNKLLRNGCEFSVESMENDLSDIAGVRIICSFLSDIYMLADALLQQDDVTLLARKDYIKNPKPNGYRSLHLIVATPIFLGSGKRMMKVEVQFRTLAMDMWASLEHKIIYKNDSSAVTEQIRSELLSCADISANIDKRMERIRSLTIDRAAD